MTVQFFRALQRSNELRRYAQMTCPPPHSHNRERVELAEHECNAVTPGNKNGRQPKWKR